MFKREIKINFKSFLVWILILIGLFLMVFLVYPSILKSDNGDDSGCNRYVFSYANPKAGIGRFIHTYVKDGNPLPSYEGEPTPVELKGNIDELTDSIWNSLNSENKVSLFVRYIEISTGKTETRIVNKNK